MSVPRPMVTAAAALYPALDPAWFLASDPAGCPLGSGGGTSHLLAQAWQATDRNTAFGDWLRARPKLLVHAGGQGRRLPAYAAVGKAFIPLPVMRWSVGQRLDQTLVDLQLPLYRRLLDHAPTGATVMVTAGDVLLRCSNALPAMPAVDILAFGQWVEPEQARHHGVFFCPRQDPDQLEFVLQKPSRDRIRELSTTHLFLIDTGIWLLSERAVALLMARSGWDEQRQEFGAAGPTPYDLYADMGPCLGSNPSQPDPAIGALSSAVVPLPDGEFYHFGASRQLIESVTRLQNLVLDQRQLGLAGAKSHPSQHTQSAVIDGALKPEQQDLWIENAAVPAGWTLASQHVLTGVPDNDWTVTLEAGVCLDFVPLDDGALCLRAYGIDDRFRGRLDDPDSLWLGQPAMSWFRSRGLDPATMGIDPQTDLQEAALFAALDRTDFDGDWINWLVAAQPATRPDFAERYAAATRLSASDLAEKIDLWGWAEQRRARTAAILPRLAENHARSVFYKLDLAATAALVAAGETELPARLPAAATADPLKHIHEAMFRAEVLRQRGHADWEAEEQRAFAALREAILGRLELQGVTPRLQLKEDQIVWGRAPVRLDLAGGWTDTPPYCLQHGGHVLNLAADLNGQPPIQVFARRRDQPVLVVRSIDLGVEEQVHTFEDLEQYAQVGSGFTIAKAALALCGFLPRFCNGPTAGSLAEQLRAFGGGIEVSMLCAVPKGSGLGTSSILAATLLGTIGELCGLDWSRNDLFRRTLGLEQMLTTGGGWQDQVGGLVSGIKLIETGPGLEQDPTIRRLPGQFFSAAHADRTVLLYYTGITRVAKDILREIVRGMFLNNGTQLAILGDIAANARGGTDAIQREQWSGLVETVARSWQLNRQLDAGTNPPAVQAILDQVNDYLAAAKLLGAGGGGYLLMLAKDETAGQRIRSILTEHPPNAKARFVSLALSETGFQVTRS